MHFFSYLCRAIYELEMYDVQKIRGDFPILTRKVYGRPLVYLDNAAPT